MPRRWVLPLDIGRAGCQDQVAFGTIPGVPAGKIIN
jgi:hypothetical protein